LLQLVNVGHKSLADYGSIAARGLVADDAQRLTPSKIGDWREVSMLREGCAIVQAAFLIFIAFWLFGWGIGALVLAARRRRKGQRSSTITIASSPSST